MSSPMIRLRTRFSSGRSDGNGARWAAIAGLLTGRYDAWLEAYSERAG